MLASILDEILEWLSGRMPTPVPFKGMAESWFHYLALFLFVLASIAAIRWLKGAEPKRVSRFVLTAGCILTGFEIYKQLVMNYQAGWNYQWYIFPFQFCSTPIYITLIAGLSKPGKFQTVLYEFLASYGLFAGLAVMMYPNSVFIDLIGINIQTMVHHGTMAVVGLALLTRVVKIRWRALMNATAVFAILFVMAFGMNLIHNTWIQDGVFNMFFINDRWGNHLPILSTIYAVAPYPIFLFVYVVGFSMAAGIMFLLGKVLRNVIMAVPLAKRASAT